MNVVPVPEHEHLGPVVPVDEGDDRSYMRQSALTLKVPPGSGMPAKPGIGRPGSSGPVSPVLTGSGHKLIDASDEHHILTTAGGQMAAAAAAASKHRNPPKFSVIVNEYVGACFEDHCNIGKFLSSFCNISYSSIMLEFKPRENYLWTK